jgi:ferritin
MRRAKRTQKIEKSQEKPLNITEVLESMRDDQRQLHKKVAELANKLPTTKEEKGEN